MSLFQQAGAQLSHTDKLSSATLDQTFADALDLLDSEGWQTGKAVNKDGQSVQGHKLPGRQGRRERLSWFRRSSEHRPEVDLTYDEFREGLLVDHTQHEQQYIPDMKNCERLKVLHQGLAEVWQMQYKTPPLASPRDFAELLLTRDEAPDSDGHRSFLVVSIPVLDVPIPKGHVRAKYLSVEHVQESTAGDGSKRIRWRMATASNGGGAIPQAITDSVLPGQIAHDVPLFIAWAKQQRKRTKSRESTTVPSSAAGNADPPTAV